MINTDRVTFLMTFTNTSTKLIFNNSAESLESTAKEIRRMNGTIDQIRLFDDTDLKFKRASRERVYRWCDHVTDFHVILDSQKFIK